jgi:hypothetical protein
LTVPWVDGLPLQKTWRSSKAVFGSKLVTEHYSLFSIMAPTVLVDSEAAMVETKANDWLIEGNG